MTENNLINEQKSTILTIYEALFCLFIIFAPITNAMTEFTFMGFTVTTVLLLLIIAFWVICLLMEKIHSRNFVLLVLLFFGIELFRLYLKAKGIQIVFISLIMLYVAALSLPSCFSKKKICASFYVSAIISAFFTLIYGYSGSSVSRSATYVDGSISIFVIAIFLFAKEHDECGALYKFIRYVAFASCFIITMFGMSRSRLLLIVLMFLIVIINEIRKFLMNGVVKAYIFFLIPLAIILIYIVLSLDIVQELLSQLSTRFDDGFESSGRDAENEVALKLFNKSKFFGMGWGDIYFVNYDRSTVPFHNHSMYLAILARGGLFMAFAFLLSLGSLVIEVIKSKKVFCIVCLSLLLLLGYGNAGIFNYTICSSLILLTVFLRGDEVEPEEQNRKFRSSVNG
ncbi:MAG: O-antigen ligase family protein [Ruminococcaceae bacterium]|nr:O-antigen ligase family protein [Oscillospiraceae bacterium]